MECRANCQFGDKEQATDLLSSEKYLSGIYHTSLLEAATPEVRQCLAALMGDVANGAQQLFEEMNSRGWYPVTPAPDMKLESEKQKFAARVCQ